MFALVANKNFIKLWSIIQIERKITRQWRVKIFLEMFFVPKNAKINSPIKEKNFVVAGAIKNFQKRGLNLVNQKADLNFAVDHVQSHITTRSAEERDVLNLKFCCTI